MIKPFPEPGSSVPSSASPSLRVALLLLIALGIAARLFISWNVIGTNDAKTWEGFAHKIMADGLIALYKTDWAMNHPPLAAEWSVSVLWLAQQSGLSFYFIFRLLPIAADAGCCWLLWRIIGCRKGEAAGLWAAALFSWCPAAILISSYHGNNDSVYVYFSLLSMYFVMERRYFFASGLALAAAINVKLIPVLLIPVLFLLCRRRRDFYHLIAGLGIGVLPFLLPLFYAEEAFLQHVLHYKSYISAWGVTIVGYFVLTLLGTSNDDIKLIINLNSDYVVYGKAAILTAVCALGLVARYSGFRNAYVLAALNMAAFLILTPGFCVQYAVAVLPLLFVADIRAGVIYGAVSGLFIAINYWQYWNGHFPVYSDFTYVVHPVSGIIGYVAWIILIKFVISQLRRFPRGEPVANDLHWE